MLKKQSENRVINAAAGSGKTTSIVEEALTHTSERVLVLAYTIENMAQIKDYFQNLNGCIPHNITVSSWYGFLLQEGVRPYQNHLTQKGRIGSIYFFEQGNGDKKLQTALRYIPETKDAHFLSKNNNIYEDKVSKFVCYCNEKSGGLIINRLEGIYDYVYIDEFQDLAGYDLTFLELLFSSRISIICAGDLRQATYSTNNSIKNRQFRKSNIIDWVTLMEKKQGVITEVKNECYRCNQPICDLADGLFPKLPKTISRNNQTTGHDGIFLIKRQSVEKYVNDYHPRILKYWEKTDTNGLPSLNIGLSKGRTYDRVLIFPTKPMLKYMTTKNVDDVGDRNKFYVAVTRAKYSVAFVED